ncbi:MAG: ChaN family lipoprotein [Chromatiales bacterium]|jgi:uncharacterized iron-regulated protein
MKASPPEIAGAVLITAVLTLTVGCSTYKPASPGEASLEDARGRTVHALDVRDPQRLDEVMDAIASHDVVLVGERHDVFAHHLNQLAVIRGLAGRWPDMAIGMEFFQRPYQQALDDYVAGRIDESEMLSRTEYFDRWRFDYRLYRPILRFARERGIPLVALNLPAEITRKVGAEGIGALEPDEAAQLPREMDRSDPDYDARLKAVYDQHPGTGSGEFERFVDVQLLWDEGMAETAADYLAQHPGRRMVILAGSGHVAHRSGIPDRLERRLGVRPAVVVSEAPPAAELSQVDFVLLSRDEDLPPPGRMGIFMEGGEGAGVRVTRVLEDSGAERAGLASGDLITALDGRAVSSPSEIRIAMIDRGPGDRILITLQRDSDGSVQTLDYEVRLGGG